MYRKIVKLFPRSYGENSVKGEVVSKNCACSSTNQLRYAQVSIRLQIAGESDPRFQIFIFQLDSTELVWRFVNKSNSIQTTNIPAKSQLEDRPPRLRVLSRLTITWYIRERISAQRRIDLARLRPSFQRGRLLLRITSLCSGELAEPTIAPHNKCEIEIAVLQIWHLAVFRLIYNFLTK